MIPILNKGISTIKNDGLIVFALRTFNFSIVKFKRLIGKGGNIDYKKWDNLKDRYKGQRIFIVGNGPSLNKMPLYLLKDEYKMCFNRFNLMYDRLNWKPDFYTVIDDLVVKDNYKEINEEILPYVNEAFFPDIHPSNVDFFRYIDNRPNVNWFIADEPKFHADLPKCGHNKTVVNAGLQIAAWLGFTEIYLIGVDMTFGEQKVKKLNSRDWEAGEDDPNHFDPRYFKKGRKYHNPTVHEMIEKFEDAKIFFDQLGVKVFNAGVGGKLEVFPRVEFNSLFNYTDSQLIDLLNSIENLKKIGKTFTYIEQNTEHYKSIESLPDMFKTGTDIGAKLIPQLIGKYNPIGPYKNLYYFVKAESNIQL
ncbi:6-hydroxymethylpterin diphosphokinase MptE-like protein [Mucilaginibacter segetis]|uniref:DUF115 domain-containing protein n=1 Tax=Mucilaginibacter segetis TaxID=2793071 RepID=A0A934UNR2_9SPHI|nr:6-hydroxymethylpterin diphosphokinase MptE-like protein [Mucilaginibacter segetis]MBK0380679.1 DUF115 domain-containing protein [Mucilaginibacter segetis]